MVSKKHFDMLSAGLRSVVPQLNEPVELVRTVVTYHGIKESPINPDFMLQRVEIGKKFITGK